MEGRATGVHRGSAAGDAAAVVAHARSPPRRRRGRYRRRRGCHAVAAAPRAAGRHLSRVRRVRRGRPRRPRTAAVVRLLRNGRHTAERRAHRARRHCRGGGVGRGRHRDAELGLDDVRSTGGGHAVPLAGRRVRVPLRHGRHRPSTHPREPNHSVSRWLMDKTSSLLATRTSRRGMLVRSAIVGSALATSPTDYIFRPISAYAAACTCRGQPCSCGTACCDGYTSFCCSITGDNSCPSGTVPAGWWRAEGSGLCGGASRYYMDCNQLLDAPQQCGCSCAGGDCNNRVTCCTHFRYGQCHQEIAQVGAIVCRVVTCTPPWQIDPTCSTADAQDDATRFHDAPCLHEPPKPPPPKTHLVTAQWFLRSSSTSGAADIAFPYGAPGDLPIVGDWDGDGVDTVGVVRGSLFLLRNSNTAGTADIAFVYGDAGDAV